MGGGVKKQKEETNIITMFILWVILSVDLYLVQHRHEQREGCYPDFTLIPFWFNMQVPLDAQSLSHIYTHTF